MGRDEGPKRTQGPVPRDDGGDSDSLGVFLVSSPTPRHYRERGGVDPFDEVGVRDPLTVYNMIGL